MSRSTAPCFEFRLVVSGFDLDNEDQLDPLLTGFDGDALVSGTTTDLIEVVVTTPGDDPVATVSSAISRLAALLPTVVVCRLDEELVGISDTAQLTGKTRESIRLYADGKRGPGTFPAPAGVAGDNVRVWRWGDGTHGYGSTRVTTSQVFPSPHGRLTRSTRRFTPQCVSGTIRLRLRNTLLLPPRLR